MHLTLLSPGTTMLCPLCRSCPGSPMIWYQNCGDPAWSKCLWKALFFDGTAFVPVLTFLSSLKHYFTDFLHNKRLQSVLQAPQLILSCTGASDSQHRSDFKAFACPGYGTWHKQKQPFFNLIFNDHDCSEDTLPLDKHQLRQHPG